jgi:hypothetical protein
MNDDVYAGCTPVTWKDVHEGSVIYIDNYEHGKFPRASPTFSGPYTVVNVERREVRTLYKVRFHRMGNGTYRTLMHYHDNMVIRQFNKKELI